MRTGNFGRWDTHKPSPARVQFGAGGGQLGISPCDAKASAGSPAPFLSPLMNIPKEFMPQSLDRFPITDRDLDPADPELREEIEEQRQEQNADLERDGI